MHLASLGAPSPPSERGTSTDREPAAPRGSDFGAVYDGDAQRRPAEAAPRQQSDGQPAAPAEASEASADASDGTVGADAGAAAPVEPAPDAEPLPRPVSPGLAGDTASIESGAANTDAPVNLGEDAPLAAAPAPTGPEASERRSATDTVSPAPRGAGAAAVMATAVDAAASKPGADAAPLGDGGAPKAATPPPQTPTPAQSANAAAAPPAPDAATPGDAGNVSVRRVRVDGEAEDGASRVDAPARRGAGSGDTPRPMPQAIAGPAAVETGLRAVAEAMPSGAVDPAAPVELAPVEGRTPAEQAARSEATVRVDTPRPVLQQVAEAARALRDGPVELTLKPEELGTVRMTLVAGADGSMTMSLQAERSETLELLRRHIGELARDLQDMGFANLSFSFGRDDGTPGAAPQIAREEAAAEAPIATIPLSPAVFVGRAAPPTGGGLDLRL